MNLKSEIGQFGLSVRLRVGGRTAGSVKVNLKSEIGRSGLCVRVGGSLLCG